MNYHYFVSYLHSQGYGNMSVQLKKKILNSNDIAVLEDHITSEVLKNDGELLKNVRIINFQLFF